MSIDTLNKFMVTSNMNPDGVSVMLPPTPRQNLTKAEALNLAAWVSVLAEATEAEVVEAFRAVRNT